MSVKVLKCVHKKKIELHENHVVIDCDDCGEIMRVVFSHLFLIHKMKVDVVVEAEPVNGGVA